MFRITASLQIYRICMGVNFALIPEVHGRDETIVSGEYVENFAVRKNIPFKDSERNINEKPVCRYFALAYRKKESTLHSRGRKMTRERIENLDDNKTKGPPRERVALQPVLLLCNA